MLVSIENIADDVLLGLWKMEDEPSIKLFLLARTKAVRASATVVETAM